jgi:hypothetical protein
MRPRAPLPAPRPAPGPFGLVSCLLRTSCFFCFFGSVVRSPEFSDSSDSRQFRVQSSSVVHTTPAPPLPLPRCSSRAWSPESRTQDTSKEQTQKKKEESRWGRGRGSANAHRVALCLCQVMHSMDFLWDRFAFILACVGGVGARKSDYRCVIHPGNRDTSSSAAAAAHTGQSDTQLLKTLLLRASAALFHC